MKIKKNKIALLLFSMFLITSCSSNNEKAEEGVELQVISQETAKDMMDNEDVYIIDVREPSEYEEGHIKNSILVPLGTLETEITKVVPDLNSTILVYCRSGNRSNQAGNKLVDMGYTNVYDIGGINTWEYGIEK